jgi:hypothetical protein
MTPNLTSRLLSFLAVGLMAVSIAEASPIPPSVTYAVSGSANDWTIDFSVDNDTNQNLYFFGVELPTTDVTGGPSSDWCTSCDTPWSNASGGGSSISYNNIWFLESATGSINPGDTLGGFTVLDTTDLAAPTSIPWFAYTSFTYTAGSPLYTGGGNFDGDFNPGFEGLATSSSAVPEPSSMGLLFATIFGIGIAARWKRKYGPASPAR